MYGLHPVSGNRDFGYEQNPNGSYTFYTRRVDRLTDFMGTKFEEYTRDAMGNGFPFRAADALWTSFVDKIREYVNDNGGNASRAFMEIERPDWQKVRDVLDGKAPLSTLSTDCED